MLRIVVRTMVVCAGLVLLLLGMQRCLTKDERPEVRMDLVITARDADGEPVRWMAEICTGGSVFLNGGPVEPKGEGDDEAGRRALAALFDEIGTLNPPIRIGGTNLEMQSHWVFAVDRSGAATLDGKPLTLAQLEARVAHFIASERVERTRVPTIQEVLDLNLPEFTIRAVDLPGFAYEHSKEAFASPPEPKEAPAAPEVVIREYRGHPMYDDRAKMPDILKAYYPDALPPVSERLPENPAVLYACDEVGTYSRTTGDTGLEDLMVWRRASSDDPVALYRKVGYPSLVRFDPAGRLAPNLAWKWEVTDNNRVYTFYLRKGHKWSDGRPFTSEDMLFSLNEVCGSPAWANSPDWMMETDGFSQLYVEDIRDWAALAARIREQAASGGPSPGKQIMKMIAEEPAFAIRQWAVQGDLDASKVKAVASSLEALRIQGVDLKALSMDDLRAQLADQELTAAELIALSDTLCGLKLEMLERFIEEHKADDSLDDRTKYRIVSRLNSLFGRRDFYLAEAWRGVDFETELSALERKGYSRLSEEELRRHHVLMWRKDRLALADRIDDETEWMAGQVTQFNLLMFRAAYADLVAPARRDRMKLEAVPDETGDTSHIVRFTFTKPNSIFLEKCATFMAYLGMCGSQKASRKKWHPDGVKEMLVFDVLDWRGLFSTMAAQAEAARASPGRHIWPMIDEALRQRLVAGPPDNDRGKDEAYKEDVVRELNRLLRRPDFWDAAAWAGADFDSELRKTLKPGYSTLQRRESDRVKVLLRRKDFLRRGPGDLDEEELLEFNLMMLRAAYDRAATDGGPEALIAKDRYDALDLQAQWRGYRTWGVLWRERGTYHRGWNDHVPTLCPWRVVSEKEDTEIVAVRNPYYFKVDARGQQLPYIDMVRDDRATMDNIRQIKLRSGRINFQTRNLEFSDFTPLKQNEKAGGYEVRLWPNDYCGEVTFFICQQHHDREYRRFLGNPKFRQALSLAMDRQEMIDIVFHGMGTPAQYAIPKSSKYFREALYKAYVEYDPDRANRLLDELGLDKRTGDGVRLLPSGRPFYLEVNAEEERPLAAVQLACKYWRAIGLDAQMKMRSGMIKWRLYRMGKYDVWVHKEGGNYFGPMVVGWCVPTHPAESVQYSAWTAWLQSGGREGLEPPEYVKDLAFMWSRVVHAPNEQRKLEAWTDLMDRAAEDVASLAISTSPGKVVLVGNNFRNVPKLALAGWIAHDSGNCNPEIFYVRQDD